MYTLYWLEKSGAFAPEAVLEELGVAYEKHRVDYREQENRDPAYLAVNPTGQIPALKLPDGTVMTETVAMIMHLSDCHPEGGLLPPPGDPLRAKAYRWLVYASSAIYEADLRQSYSDRYTTDPEGVAGVRAAADAKIEQCWALIEETIGDGPYFLGETFSVVDIQLAMLVGWHHDLAAFLESSPKVAAMVDAVRNRPKIAPLWKVHYGHKPAFQ